MTSRPIRSAVVPVAGRGTRLLPATRAQAKEMLAVLDKPVIQYVVDELCEAGIERVLLVTARGKGSIEDHFDAGTSGIAVLSTRQPSPRGLGDAVLCSEPFAAGQPFVLALGDSIIAEPRPGGLVRRLLDAHTVHGAACTVAVEVVAPENSPRRGMVVPAAGRAPGSGEAFDVATVVEKPSRAPSELGVAARYVLAPSLFDLLRDTPAGHGGEVQVTDAIAALIERGERVVGVRLSEEEHRHDIGDVEGYARAFLAFALADPRFGASLRDHARELLDADRHR
ncbi:MAG: UTP--glucose-1-phosphate uridylyltransferase [Solirubrobacteraceae bacterium]